MAATKTKKSGSKKGAAKPKAGGKKAKANTATEASDALSELHHRMPAILPKGKHRLWLDGEFEDYEKLQGMLVPYERGFVTSPVSTLVNSPKNEKPECVEAVQN